MIVQRTQGRRAWSAIDNAWGVTIAPGELYVTTTKEVIITVLGSCVSACIRDPRTGIAGMNHYMLPGSARKAGQGLAARFGVYAMEVLVNEILKTGARRADLEVKLVGGGRMWKDGTDIGAENIAFARGFVAAEGLRMVACDVGGEHARRVHFRTADGAVRVKKLGEVERSAVHSAESAYRGRLKDVPRAGAVELF